jgi:ABC-type methionine transport system ATPase subunit
MALLSFEGVGKRYRRWGRDVVVLDDVRLDVDPGDFVGVWGSRRAGKSTLLRLAAGIELADAGVVRFDGRDLSQVSSRERARLWRRDIGFVSPERRGPAEQVVPHVAMPLVSDGWAPDEAAGAARRTLKRVDAAGCAHAATYELSPGDQTLVALARALVRQPRLLLVDEPAITQSPSERDRICEVLRSVGREPELTVVVASEDLSPLRAAGRMMSIGEGRVLLADRPGTVVPFPAGSSRSAGSSWP